MLFPGFVGARFKSPLPQTAVSELINYYVEPSIGADKSPFPASLLRRPGILARYTGMHAPIRGEFSQDGRAFVVGGDILYELTGYYTYNVLGTVARDDSPASMDSNGHGGHQLCIISGGLGYIFDLAANTFQQITDPSFPSNAVNVVFLDGYFFVTQATTSTVFISASFNGLVWDATDEIQVSSSSDELQITFVINRNLWMLSSQSSEPWVTTSASSIVAPMSNVSLEYGIAARWSVAQCDGTLCFVAKSPQGGPVIAQISGYQIAEISTSSECRLLEALPDLSSVQAFSYTESGHTFYVVCPNTGPALVYDLATGVWATWGQWNYGTGTYDPLAQMSHMYAFGKHLVGDRTTGTVYEQSTTLGTDNGTPIRRVRTAPYITTEQQPNFIYEITIGLNTGDGNADDPNPTMDLKWTKDWGNTWSTPRTVSLGVQGQYKTRVSWHQVPGLFEQFAMSTITSSPSHIGMNACYLGRPQPGTGMR